MLGSETVESLLAAYDEVARGTDKLVRTLPDLNAGHADIIASPWRAH